MQLGTLGFTGFGKCVIKGLELVEKSMVIIGM